LIIDHNIISLILIITSFLLIIISIINYKYFNSLIHTKYLNSSPLISILIPARNEEKSILRCLNSLINQNYKNTEVLILNDNSTDNTYNVIKNFIKNKKNISLLNGASLPKNWIGKHWACEQLSKKAKGEYILFLDADTAIKDDTILNAINQMEIQKADLLTTIPKKKPRCIAEKLLFPFIDWTSLAFIPIKISQKLNNSYLSATFGQFMLFRKGTYKSIGGHKKIKDNVLDDINLGRMIKKQGYKWILIDGTKYVESQMYENSKDTIKGVSRSIFPAFNYHLSLFIFTVIILILLGIAPTYILLSDFLIGTNHPINRITFSYITLTNMIISWAIVCVRFNHNILTALIHPIIITLMILTGIHSLASNMRGSIRWKGRKISKRNIRI
tara:strand:- start:9106 stop:10266 length:1161 start_codon:yes stop_codon:yes gene_type:complete